MNRNRILLVYPKTGLQGSLIRHLPLSLLYAAVDAVKEGFDIAIEDVRLDPRGWQERIAGKITADTIIVGVSVMSGTPIRSALEISRWVKRRHPDVRVVWGGPHATFNGREILAEPSVDYVVSGYGSKPLARLAAHLRDRSGSPADIPGLVYRGERGVEAVAPAREFEHIDYRDIPYHLVEGQFDRYGQFDNGQRIFPLYSALGCPYQCAFCSAPSQYQGFQPRYVTLMPRTVVDHIEFVQRRYGATYIYVIDDDSFVNPAHVEAILDELRRRDIRIELGFRGARVNEILKMSDAFLDKLAAAGVRILHIGAESGSQRILDLTRKGFAVEDIVAVNRKLARHPGITALYNWIVGLPGETERDLRETMALMLRLVEENPSAIIYLPNKYRPLPGTELYALALAHGYAKPERLEDWIDVEMESDYRSPWYTKRSERLMNMMQVASLFIDDKLSKVETGDTWKFRTLKVLARLYAPCARFRLKHGFAALPIENWLFRRYASCCRLC